MAARALSSGTISFGLVSIPVKVYSATKSQSVSFNQLHAKDRARLKQQLVCSACNEVVERTDTVKGYEHTRDQYVIFTGEELAALQRASDKSIDITEFVPIEKVDPIYFDKATLLGPDKGGAKPYRLLHQAMLEAGRVAIGRFSTRGKLELVLLRPVADGIMMHSLLYADEVRGFDDVELGDKAEFRAGELDLAHQLIDQLSTGTFDASRYEDDYRRDLLAAIDRKVAGEEVVTAPPEAPREQIIDLVAALKRSLEAQRGGAGAAPAAAKAVGATTDEAAAAEPAARKPAKAKGKEAAPAARRKAASG